MKKFGWFLSLLTLIYGLCPSYADRFDTGHEIHYATGSLPRNPRAADIDCDGDLDIAGVDSLLDLAEDGNHTDCSTCGSVAWWENADGVGNDWILHVIETDLHNADRPSPFDFDQDGWTDIAAVSLDDSDGISVAWWRNVDGGGLSWARTIIATQSALPFPQGLAVADIDQDCDPDVVSSSWGSGEVVWFENQIAEGTPTWTPRIIDSSFPANDLVVIGDFDGDGYPDVLGAREGADAETAIWLNPAASADPWSKVHVAEGTGDQGVADVDSDCDLDIVGAQWGISSFLWWENNNGDGLSWLANSVVDPATPFPTYTHASHVQGFDVDGDCDTDLVGDWGYPISGLPNRRYLVWWENTGPDSMTGLPFWDDHLIDAGDPDFEWPSGNDIADISGDGVPDLLAWSARNDGPPGIVRWYQNLGGALCPSPSSSCEDPSLCPAAPLCQAPFCEASIDIEPRTINLKSRGKWVTVSIALPANQDAADIDPTSIAIIGLSGEGCDPDYYQPADFDRRPRIGDQNRDGVRDITLKFDRELLQQNLCLGQVEILIGGAVKDGCEFEGADTIRVIQPGKNPHPGRKPRSATK